MYMGERDSSGANQELFPELAHPVSITRLKASVAVVNLDMAIPGLAEDDSARRWPWPAGDVTTGRNGTGWAVPAETSGDFGKLLTTKPP
ncbi:MAG TPA: hypothetical protein VES73_03285, partial [Lamprocystis sp. (in: g-proteobacteria)]|nr:hypothetical protein [Lamprocystis sp. (in: g-proteobacteria)]